MKPAVRESGPGRISIDRDGTTLRLTLAGCWAEQQPEAAFEAMTEAVSAEDPGLSIVIDGRGIESWDSSLVNLVFRFESWCRGQQLKAIAELPDAAMSLLSLVQATPIAVDSPEEDRSLLASALAPLNPLSLSQGIGRQLAGLLEFTGALWAAGLRALMGKSRMRTSDVLRFAFQTGPNALPIISLTSFLVGMILGYLGAVQLQQFGAGIYVANLVTVGVLREMGALMTAVVLAGRTGAAYAAQLGSMRVNEEIDAIEILGLSTTEFLALPRVLAITLMAPLLTLYANMLGILGGGVVATGLGISPLQYWTQAELSLLVPHLSVGLVKSVIFGALVGIAGCRAGLASAKNSEGVGQATTEAVVTALVYLIIADAAINIFCQLLDV